jgi:dipeptide/tripeptide permease
MFDQHGSSWVIQAGKMNLSFLGVNLQPEMLQAMNPIMVMVLIPFCVFVIYPIFKLSPIKRIGFGMFIAGLSFIMIGLIEEFVSRGGAN